MKRLEYHLHRLSAEEVMESLMLEEQLCEELMKKDFNRELIQALSEYGTLCYMTLYCGEKRYFASPHEALQKLSIDHLADVYDAYVEKFYSGRQCLERGINESFASQTEGRDSFGDFQAGD